MTDDADSTLSWISIVGCCCCWSAYVSDLLQLYSSSPFRHFARYSGSKPSHTSRYRRHSVTAIITRRHSVERFVYATVSLPPSSRCANPNPDPNPNFQNVSNTSPVQSLPIPQISWKSTHNFLRHPANEQRDRQTDKHGSKHYPAELWWSVKEIDSYFITWLHPQIYNIRPHWLHLTETDEWADRKRSEKCRAYILQEGNLTSAFLFAAAINISYVVVSASLVTVSTTSMSGYLVYCVCIGPI